MQEWRQHAAERREEREREAHLAHALAVRRASSAFTIWHGLYRALTHYRTMLVRRALFGWADHAAHKQDVRESLAAAQHRLRHSMRTRCFAAWFGYAKVGLPCAHMLHASVYGNWQWNCRS